VQGTWGSGENTMGRGRFRGQGPRAISSAIMG